MSILDELISDCICDADVLAEHLGLSDSERSELKNITERYPVRITPYYLGLIDKNDRNDPIRKMCVPDITEYSEGGLRDTSGEELNTVVTGLQHKYANTALILSTSNCAVYCRHCFRKRMVGLQSHEVAKSIPDMTEYVKDHPEIDNVLISGGDAFMNDNLRIREYLEAFCALDNIRFIRFGTRTPAVMPQRITKDPELTDILKEYGEKKRILVVTQFNHPAEITEESREAVHSINSAGIAVRNQTVLLRGVNDSHETLAKLMNELVCMNVTPYYVFQCRPVLGVKNQFQVPVMKGIEILKKTKGLLSGIAGNYKYVMSHPAGKIEIIGKMEEKTVFRFHEAKDPSDQGRVFTKVLKDSDCWLEDI